MSACGGTYDTQCAGSGGVDCTLLGLSVCTSEYGDRAPHAFCTLPCESDDVCGADGRCALWPFARGSHRVCVAANWLH